MKLKRRAKCGHVEVKVKVKECKNLKIGLRKKRRMTPTNIIPLGTTTIM
jgi:hypothetical protein